MTDEERRTVAALDDELACISSRLNAVMLELNVLLGRITDAEDEQPELPLAA